MNFSKRYGYAFLQLFVVIALLLSCRNASAQTTASLAGRVEDSSGAGIPEATISVTNQETGVTRAVTSDDSGNYRVLSLPVGGYEIRAEKAGFKVAVQTGITLVVDQQAVVKLTLEVGQVQQQVTVTAEVPLVNTATTSIAGLVGEKEVKDLPLNGRSFDNLIALDAGAATLTAQRGGGAAAQVGNTFGISGHRWYENMVYMNGVEYMGPSQIHSEPGGVSGQLLGIDAVREFNVVSDAYGVEYGKRAGGQVSVVTQSGTNQLHGTLFEFIRNSVLDAANYFDHPLGERIPPFKRNQFGAALGGPIRKDNTFVFGNYEGFRQRLGVSAVAFVPDNCSRNDRVAPTFASQTPYALSQCLGAVPGASAGMLPYMAYWPTPNGPELGGGAAEAFYNPPQKIREDFGIIRVDHTFSSKDSLGTSYLFDDGVSLSPMANPNWAQNFQVRSQVFSLQETHIFSSNIINTFTLGFSRVGFHYQTPPRVSISPSLEFLTGDLFGRISIGGIGTGGSSSITVGGGALATDQKAARTMYTFQDGLQIIRGRHQISAGLGFEPLGSNELAPKNQSGVATFSTLTSFLQGTVSNFSYANAHTRLYWRQLEGNWYVQDIIQLRPNLTLRLGLRHEFTNGWNEADGRASNYRYGSNGVLITTPFIGDSPYTQNNSKWLFGPRVGIAWDPFGTGRTSIHAGFGTHYDLLDVLGTFLDQNPPFNGSATFLNQSLLSIIPINPSAPLAPACGPGVPTPCVTYAAGGVYSTDKTPTVEEWTLTVDQQISPNTSINVGYVGSHGFHQEVGDDINTIPPQICSSAAGCLAGGTLAASSRSTVSQGTLYVPVTTVPNTFLASGTMMFTIGNSSYNGLNVGVTHRFSHGLQFRANYTWSRNLDIQTGTSSDENNQPGFLYNLYNAKMDWGPAAENKTHKFVLNGTYELPLGANKPFLNWTTGVRSKLVSGWQFNWIFTATSGFNFDTQSGSNRSGDGDAGNPDRPSWNPAFTGSLYNTGNPTQWFNPNAFILPPGGTFGNVSRDALVGPNLRELDASLFKTTSITERLRAEFRVEAFNLFNRPNFSTPANLSVFQGTAVSPSAGIISTTSTTSRQIQFGLKLVF